MATLSPELVTQRASAVTVAYQASGADNANGIVMWSATSAGERDQVVTDTVAAGEDTRAEIDATLDATPTQ